MKHHSDFYFLLMVIGNLQCVHIACAVAMQSAVLARAISSVCQSVCPSVTLRYCVQTNEGTIVQFSASDRTIPLVSGEVKFIQIYAGDYPQRGR